jgi:hypothetical protein
MQREDAQRIVKGFLARLIVDGTIADAIATAGISEEDAHELRNAAMVVGYELSTAANIPSAYTGLAGIVAQVTGRAEA